MPQENLPSLEVLVESYERKEVHGEQVVQEAVEVLVLVLVLVQVLEQVAVVHG